MKALESAVKVLYSFGDKVLSTLLILIIAVAAYYIGKITIKIFSRINTKTKNPRKLDTLNTIFLSFYKYIIYFVAAFSFLKNVLNVDLAALVTVAGVGGIAIAFGSQAMVKDAITGLFIFIEGQFFVGDRIEVKGTVGRVLDMGFRVTKIETEAGDMMYIPNSEMSIVTNLSRNSKKSVALSEQEDNGTESKS